MITGSQASATPATQNSTKAQACLKRSEWNFGRTRTEKRLPCYLNGGFYIPDFSKMTFETVQLQRQLHENE